MTTFNNQAAINNQAGVQNNYGHQYNGPVHIMNPAPPPVDSPDNVHWFVPRTVNRLFSGREEILERIEQKLRDGATDRDANQQCCIVITGLGGQGKSELCLRIANDLRQHFWGVFWVDVSTPDQAKAGFITLSKRIGSAAETFDEALHNLANIRRSWLLILDNADEVEFDYQTYFPSGNSGCILVTSRNPECGIHATVGHEKLEGLDDTSARRLLLNSARIPKDEHLLLKDDTQNICGILGSHPLALIQAGSYIAEGHCSLSQYQLIYQEQRKRLLEFHPAQARSRHGNVYATFEASAAALQHLTDGSAQDALDLLLILSMLAFNPLPLAVFEAAWEGVQHVLDDEEDNQDLWYLRQWHVNQLIPLITADPNRWDKFRLSKAVQHLKSLALVFEQTHSTHTCIYMHPLTHAWAKDRQSQDKQIQSWITTGSMVALSSADDLWLRSQQLLQPHLLALIEHREQKLLLGGPQTMLVRIWIRHMYLLYFWRLGQKHFSVCQSLLNELNLDTDVVQEQWLELYQRWAESLRLTDGFEQSASIMTQIIDLRGQSAAETDIHLLSAQHMLAGIYLELNCIDEAVILLEHVVKIRERAQAEDNPRRLGSQHELARAYLESGQVERAVTLLEYVVEIRERVLVEDHPSRLASKHWLVIALWDDDQRERAITVMEDVVLTYRRIHPIGHRDLVAAEESLAFFNAEMNGMIAKHDSDSERSTCSSQSGESPQSQEEQQSKMNSEKDVSLTSRMLQEYNRDERISGGISTDNTALQVQEAQGNGTGKGIQLRPTKYEDNVSSLDQVSTSNTRVLVPERSLMPNRQRMGNMFKKFLQTRPRQKNSKKASCG